MTVEIIYETHAMTTDNESGVATGWYPGELSEAGRHSARQLGERHRGDGIVTVFASDLARAVETARIAFSDSGIPVHEDARLRECNYGELNGMPVDQLRQQQLQHIDEPFPGGQSYRQVVAEMDDFLEDLSAGWEGRKVLIIAHSANKWALDHLLNGVPLEDLVAARFEWQEGWQYTLPSGWADLDA